MAPRSNFRIVIGFFVLRNPLRLQCSFSLAIAYNKIAPPQVMDGGFLVLWLRKKTAD